MDLTPYQQDVYSGKICPYCKSKVKVVSEEFIYGKKFTDKKMICCINYPTCDSYVGTHLKDGTALGRLSNQKLRLMKKETHEVFDRIWKLNYLTRDEAYEHLSVYLNIPREYTHLGYFNCDTLDIVKKYAIKFLIEHAEKI